MCANLSTPFGSHCIGTNAPQRKLDPRAMTFTIPLIAFLFKTILPMNIAIVVATIVNTKQFSI